MTLMPLHLTLLVIASGFFGTIAVWQLVSGDRIRVRMRIQRFIVEPYRQSTVQGGAADAAAQSGRTQVRTGRWSGFWEKQRSQLADRLEKANVLLKPREFVIITLGSTVVIALLLYVVGGNVIGVLGGLVGLVLPQFYLNWSQRQRAKKLEQQIPDMLMLLSNGLKAGHGFLQAAEIVTDEMDAPMSLEFKKLLRETSMGVTTEDALNNLTARVDNEDLDMVITAVIIQRQVGGNLAEVLDNIHHTIQERIRIKDEIQTLTAQGRISALIISLLPIGVGAMILLISPDFMDPLFSETLGLIMVGAAVFFEMVGVYFIRRIVDIEV